MKHDITITRARTRVLKVYIYDASGNPYVLGSDEKLIFGVKKSLTDSNYVIKKIVTYVDYDENSHSYSFAIYPSDTTGMNFGVSYFYDVGLQNGTNYFTVIETSRFILEGNVTEKEV